MTNDTFRAAVGGGSTTIQVTRADGAKADIYLETTDGFFDIYEYAIGVKTGVTLLAGPSFAGAPTRTAASCTPSSSTRPPRRSVSKTPRASANGCTSTRYPTSLRTAPKPPR